jgi:hypothetical protein
LESAYIDDIDDLINSASVLMDEIKVYLDQSNRNNDHTQRLVEMADELVEQLCVEKEEAHEQKV